MNKIVEFKRKKDPLIYQEGACMPIPKFNPHALPDEYTLSQLAYGIEVALFVTKDQETVKILNDIFQKSIASGMHYAVLSKGELARVYGYIDCEAEEFIELAMAYQLEQR